MLKKIKIIFDKKYVSGLSLKYETLLKQIEKEMQTERISFCWQCAGFDEALSEERTGCLYITDSPEIFEILRLKGFYAAALLHDGNGGASFNGNCYILEGLEGVEHSYLEDVYRRLAGQPWDILETKRLKVRESTVEDVDEFYRIYREPSITYYMENLFEEPDMEKAYIKNYIRQVYGFYGYGLWTVLLKETGQIIGRAGLSVRDGYELPELGFVIEAAQQRKGYACEVCRAILDYTEKQLQFDAVQAMVKKDNKASVSLLNKLGFAYQKNVYEEGTDYHLYVKRLV